MMPEFIPEIILYNGKLYTLDPLLPSATALAVTGKWITAVGQDADILSMAGPKTRVINLDHRLVLPGLWDTHFHFFSLPPLPAGHL